MKQLLVNTILGHYALRFRAKVEIIKAAIFNWEQVGFIANDQIGEHLLVRLGDPDKIFVDIGAHIGSIISEVLCCKKSMQVIAIEAIPAKAEKLRKKFQGIEIRECAVGSETGNVSFFIDAIASGCSSLSRPTDENGRFTEITVPMKLLDELIPEDGVDIIKIDVEGAELDVIRGGLKVINSNQPVLYFESGSDVDAKVLTDIWHELNNLNYRIMVPNRLAHNDEDGLNLAGFLESHMYPRRSTNYFAIPTERRNEIRDRARNVLGILV